MRCGTRMEMSGTCGLSERPFQGPRDNRALNFQGRRPGLVEWTVSPSDDWRGGKLKLHFRLCSSFCCHTISYYTSPVRLLWIAVPFYALVMAAAGLGIMWWRGLLDLMQ